MVCTICRYSIIPKSGLTKCNRNIHLRSLIGACTCMRVYMNSLGHDAQSEQGISKMLRGKSVDVCKERIELSLRNAQIVRWITTWFISELRIKSCDRKTSTQSRQKTVFKRIRPHSPVCGNICLSHSLWLRHEQLDYFVQQAYGVGLLSSAHLVLVLFCEPSDQGQVRIMSVQPDQTIRFRTTIFWLWYNLSVSGILAAKMVRKDTVCHVHTINIKIRLHSLLN